MRGSQTARAVAAGLSMGGRLLTLPPGHLDTLAGYVRDAHVWLLPKPLVELLVSGRFARSRDPWLARATPVEVAAHYRELSRRSVASRRRSEARRLHLRDPQKFTGTTTCGTVGIGAEEPGDRLP